MILPQPPSSFDPAVRSYFQSLIRAIEANQKGVLAKSKSTDQLLLSSPDKSVWSIQVDDAGALSATKVAGG